MATSLFSSYKIKEEKRASVFSPLL